MPCKDAEATLAASISSVLEQSYSNWELIVVDDGSTDASAAIASRLASSDSRIKPICREPGAPHGAAEARNRGLEEAKGRYVAFLDADDIWLPHKLQTQIDAMLQGNASFSCTAYFVERPNRADVLRRPPRTFTRADLLRRNHVGCLTAIYDQSQLGAQPMPEIPMRHDYALWLHLLTLTDRAIGLPEPLAIHRRQRRSLSANPIKASYATWCMLRNQSGLGAARAARSLVSHSLSRFFKG